MSNTLIHTGSKRKHTGVYNTCTRQPPHAWEAYKPAERHNEK